MESGDESSQHFDEQNQSQGSFFYIDPQSPLRSFKSQTQPPKRRKYFATQENRGDVNARANANIVLNDSNSKENLKDKDSKKTITSDSTFEWAKLGQMPCCRRVCEQGLLCGNSLKQSIQGNKVLNFQSRLGRVALLIFMVCSMLPTLIYHINLKIRSEASVLHLSNELKTDDANGTPFDTQTSSSDEKLRYLESIISFSSRADQLDSDDMQTAAEVKEEYEQSERQNIINLSNFYVIFCFTLLCIALVFAILDHKLMTRRALAVIVQLSLTGFLPLQILKAPHYPLMTLNVLLYAEMATLNTLYLARGLTQQMFIFLITALWSAMMYVWRHQNSKEHEFFTQLSLDQPASILMPDSSPCEFMIHFWITSLLTFLGVSLAGTNLRIVRKQMNKLALTQIERLYEIMGQEDKPFVVAKVLEKGRIRSRSLDKLTIVKLQQFGFDFTYISDEFERFFLRSEGLQVEDIVFRRVECVENSRLQPDSCSDSDDDLVEIPRKNLLGGANSGVRHFTTTQEKHMQESEETNRWLNKDANLFNFKMLIDNWNPELPVTHNYEIKSVQQLKKESISKLLKRNVPKNESVNHRTANRTGQTDLQRLILFESPDSDPRQQQPINPFDVNNQDHDEEAKERIVNFQARQLKKQMEQIKRETEREKELASAQVFVRIKIRQVVRGTSLFRIAQITKIQKDQATKQEQEQEDESEENGYEGSANNQEEQRIVSPGKIQSARIKPMSNFSSNTNQKRMRAEDLVRHKMYKIVLKLMPDQLTHLSTIANCAEGIIFNIQKILEEKKSSIGGLQEIARKFGLKKQKTIDNTSKQTSHNSLKFASKQPFRRGSSVLLSPSISSPTSQKKPNSIDMRSHQTNQTFSFSKEIEMYSKTVITSAQIISQILESSIMCKKIATMKLGSVPIEVLLAGPKGIATEVNDTISQLLDEKRIRVKVIEKSDRANQVAYPWPFYKSLLFHLLVWSVNNSQTNRRIIIEIDIIELDECYSSRTSHGRSYKKSKQDKTEQNQSFLTTTIAFQGISEYLDDSMFRKSIRSDPNYLICKFNTSLIGGKLFNISKKGIVMSLFLLPLNPDVFEAFGDRNSPDRDYWKQKNRNIFTAIKEQTKIRIGAMSVEQFTRPIEINLSDSRKEPSSLSPSRIHQSQSSYQSGTIPSRLSEQDENHQPFEEMYPPKKSQQMNSTIQEEESQVSSQNSKDNSSFISEKLSSGESFVDLNSAKQSKKDNSTPSNSEWQEDIRLALIDADDDRDKVVKEKKKKDRGVAKADKKSESFKKRLPLLMVPGMSSKKDNPPLQRLQTIVEESVNEIVNEIDNNSKRDSIQKASANDQPNNGSSQRSENAVQVSQSSYIISADADEEAYGDGGDGIENHLHNMNHKYYVQINNRDDGNHVAGINGPEKKQMAGQKSVQSRQSSKSSFENSSKKSSKKQSQHIIKSKGTDRIILESQSGHHDQRLLRVEPSSQQQPIEEEKEPPKKSSIIEQHRSSSQILAAQINLGGDQKSQSSSISQKSSLSRISSKRSSTSKQEMIAAAQASRERAANANNVEPRVAAAAAEADHRQIILELPEEEKKEEEKEHLLYGARFIREEEAGSSQSDLSNPIELDEEEQKCNSAQQENSFAVSSGTEGGASSQSGSESDRCDCKDTVLLIENVCYNIIPIKMQVRSLIDVHVETCTNGKQGLERYVEDISKKCCRKYFHIILMDLNMPMLGGYDASSKIHEVYEKIRQEPGQSNLPKPVIFAVSVTMNDLARQQAQESKMVGFLNKPIKREEFQEAIRRHLSSEVIQRLEKK